MCYANSNTEEMREETVQKENTGTAIRLFVHRTLSTSAADDICESQLAEMTAIIPGGTPLL
jgi:hypothetical protein